MSKSKVRSNKSGKSAGNGKHPAKLFNLLGIVVLLTGVIAGVILVGRKLIVNQAAVPGGTASVSIEPTEGSYKSGDEIKSKVYFSTAGTPISGVAVRLIFTYEGATQDVQIRNITVNPELTESGDWVCPTQSSSIQGTTPLTDIACANTSASGFSGENTLLAEITTVVTNSNPDISKTLIIRFDPALSVVTKKSDNRDILAIPTSNAMYKIGNFLTPTPTGKKDCSVRLFPASLYLPTGVGANMRAVVTGKKVTSVRFSSDKPDYVSVKPESDNKLPYTAVVKSLAPFDSGSVLVWARAFLGQNELCSGFAVVKTAPSASLTPRLSPRPSIVPQ